jgi:hypothetical protein
MVKEKEENWFQFMAFSMKEHSKTINLMALEHYWQVKVFTVDNLRMA